MRVWGRKQLQKIIVTRVIAVRIICFQGVPRSLNIIAVVYGEQHIADHNTPESS